MFAIQTHNVKSITSYERAEQFFNSYPKPRSHKWADHERPLRIKDGRGDSSAVHLKLVKHEHLGIPCYDLVLYSTPMVRYFKPDTNGDYAVWLGNHSSRSTAKFMENALWGQGQSAPADDGRRVFVGALSYATHVAHRLWGDQFVSRLVFNRDGVLDTRRSVTIPVFRRVSTKNRMDERTVLRQRINIVLDILDMNYNDAVDNTLVVCDRRKYGAFRGTQVAYSAILHQRAENALRMDAAYELTSEDMQSIVEYGKEMYEAQIEFMINRRVHEGVTNRWVYETLPFQYDTYVRDQEPEFHAKFVPTQDAVRKAMENKFIKLANLNKPDGYEELPMFLYAGTTPALNRLYGNVPYKMNHEDLDCYELLAARRGMVYEW